MPSTHQSLRSLYFLLFLLNLNAAWAQQPSGPAARAATIAPFLDEQTLAVGRVDLSQLDAAAIVNTIREIAPPDDAQVPQDLQKLDMALKAGLTALRGAGISEFYAVISLADMPKEPYFLVAPVRSGADVQAAAEGLRQLLRFEAADRRAGVVLVGTKTVIDRLKTIRPAARPEFARGFEKAGSSAAQLIFAPNPDTRRVLREMLPRLPDEIGGGSGKMLADGIQWAVLGVDAPPRLELSLTIQSSDPDTASALRGIIVSMLALMRQTEGPRNMPNLDEVIRYLTPQLKGDQLIISLADRDGSARAFLHALLPAFQLARTAAGRSQSMNNLKQIGLAMHNFHDVHKHLPPEAIRSKDGKPLLSWRVALLPFLDADALYKEFHLDEPWDSEHNKKLIEKMPPSFASPHLGDARKAQGLTSYLVPLSSPGVGPAPLGPSAGPAGAPPPPPEALQTAFDNPTGTAFSKIIDGTSNTIMVLEANPTFAVIWTKPADLIIDEKDLLKNLRGQPNEGFPTLFCDGSVRFIKEAIDLKTFLHLLQMNDGNPIGPY